MVRNKITPPVDLTVKYEDVVKAVGYWIVLDDMSSFFRKSNMPLVSQHLMLACQEIDKLWQELEAK